MRNTAKQDIKSLLPKEIYDSCAVTNVGIEFEQKNKENPKPISSTVFMHRIVDGTPVRGNSYIQLHYDSNGNLFEFYIYWPKYRKKNVSSLLSSKEQSEAHIKLLNLQIDEINQSIAKEKAPVKGELKKSVRTLKTWHSGIGAKYLIPNVTYIGKYTSENEDQSIIVDIPLDETIIPKEKAIVFDLKEGL